MSRMIRILLADDHALVRRTLCQYLEAEVDLSVVADVGDADAAATEALRLRPDVVMLDVDMPGLLPFDAARLIRARCPGTRILFLSAFYHDSYIKQALDVGASGYVTKSQTPETVVEAVRAVASGAAFYSPDVRDRIVVDSGGARLSSELQPRAFTLTDREKQVLQYIARGLSKKEIASTLHLSERTVNCHCASLMGKLDIHDRVQLTKFAIREGFTSA